MINELTPNLSSHLINYDGRTSCCRWTLHALGQAGRQLTHPIAGS
jgi:hypothetical protein